MRWIFSLVFLLTPLLAAAHDPKSEIKFVRAWENGVTMAIMVSNTKSRKKDMSCVGFNADGVPLFQERTRPFHLATEFHMLLNGTFSAADVIDVKCEYLD